MMGRVDSGLSAVEVSGRHPLCDAVRALAGGPALVGELVVRSAAQSQLREPGLFAVQLTGREALPRIA